MGNNTKSLSEIHNRAEIDNGDGTSSLRISGAIAVGGTRVKIQRSQDLSLAPFEYVTTQANDFYFRGLTINVTDGLGTPVDITEDIALTIDEGDDNFDVAIIEENTLDENGNPTHSFAFFPDSNVTVFGSAGTQFKVTVTNVNLTGTVNMSLYLEVI